MGGGISLKCVYGMRSFEIERFSLVPLKKATSPPGVAKLLSKDSQEIPLQGKHYFFRLCPCFATWHVILKKLLKKLTPILEFKNNMNWPPLLAFYPPAPLLFISPSVSLSLTAITYSSSSRLSLLANCLLLPSFLSFLSFWTSRMGAFLLYGHCKVEAWGCQITEYINI